MTTDEAINICKALWAYKSPNYTDSEIREALDMAIESFENNDKLAEDLQNCLEMYKKKKAEVEALKNQWIPCSERLPSEDAYYLVTLGNGIAEDGQDIEMCAWAAGHWDWWNTDLVIAWMPLPEPWKGETE